MTSLKTMNPCHECEETEYVAKSGAYYCTTCGTKYQGKHDMEAEMDDTNKNFSFTKIRSAKKQKLAHVLKKSDQAALSAKKCNKYELFQILLKHQVEALIKLGAHPKLKDVVFEIWMKYLAVTKIAFYDQDEKTLLENTQTKEANVKKTEKSSITLLSKDQEEDMELEHDEFMEENKDDMLDDEQSETVADDTDKHLPARHRMKLPYTLALCYLGLIYTNPLTTFIDLIRWVKDFKIPFCNAGDYLPKDGDVPFRRTFTAYTDPSTINSFTVRYLQRDVKVMALYLDLKDSPPIPLRMFVQKYTSLLNLPDDIHAISSELVESRSVKILCVKRKSVLMTNLEVTATSYVVVILKLLFGFDGHTENLTSVKEKFTQHTKNGQSAHSFVTNSLKDKIKNMSRSAIFIKLYDPSSRKTCLNDINRHTLFDLEEWVRFMKEQMLMASRQETADPLTSGSERNKDTETSSKSQSVYAPLVTLSRIWDRRRKEDQSTGSNVTDNISSDTSLQQQYFRHSSLQHILHPESFLKSLDQFKLGSVHDVLRDRGAQDGHENSYDRLQAGKSAYGSLHSSEKVIRSKQTSSLNIDNEQSNASKFKYCNETRMNYTDYNGPLCNQSADYNLSLDSLANSHTETSHSNRIETNDVTRLQKFLKTNLRTTKVKNVEQFDDAIQKIIFTRNALHSNYAVCPKQTTSIYDEVINICSNLVITQPNMLHRSVKDMEKGIFNEMKRDLTNSKTRNKMSKK